MKKLLVKRNDGGVSIIIPSSEATPELLERDAKAVSGYISHEEIEDSAIPTDRSFRNAWGHDLKVDLTKAKDIIRNRRNKSLEELDKKAFTESRKPNGDLDAINAEAQRLRDIPQQSNFNSKSVNTLLTVLKSTDLQI